MPTDFTLQSKIIVNFIFFMYVDEKKWSYLSIIHNFHVIETQIQFCIRLLSKHTR